MGVEQSDAGLPAPRLWLIGIDVKEDDNEIA